MLTRSRLTAVSPSLRFNEPAARRGGQSPSLAAARAAEADDDANDAGGEGCRFRPIDRDSPSLDIAELLGSPTSRNNSRCQSPSLGLIAREAMVAPGVAKAVSSSAPMTTASCKRASRMARPAEPSPAAAAAAAATIKEREAQFAARKLQRLLAADVVRFKLSNASTGKGPAVKASSGDSEADAIAQAKMNHVCHCTLPPISPASDQFLCTADGLHQVAPRRLRQPGAHVAAGHAVQLPRDVRKAGRGSDQKVRL